MEAREPNKYIIKSLKVLSPAITTSVARMLMHTGVTSVSQYALMGRHWNMERKKQVIV